MPKRELPIPGQHDPPPEPVPGQGEPNPLKPDEEPLGPQSDPADSPVAPPAGSLADGARLRTSIAVADVIQPAPGSKAGRGLDR